MKNHTLKIMANSGLDLLKGAVFEVLSHKEGMKRQEVIDELELCLPPPKNKHYPKRVIASVLHLLAAEDRVECRGSRWYICG